MRVMGEVQTEGPHHQCIIPVADPAALLVDLQGEGSRHNSSKFSLTSPFSLAQLRARMREQVHGLIGVSFRIQAQGILQSKENLPTERAVS